MAYITSDSVSASLRANAGRALAGLERSLSAYAYRRSRRAQVEYLESLSDADLAARGLTRDDIIPHVFRDKMLAL